MDLLVYFICKFCLSFGPFLLSSSANLCRVLNYSVGRRSRCAPGLVQQRGCGLVRCNGQAVTSEKIAGTSWS